ncbi:DUF6527 family protein [Vibrio furnissii]|uniref:DUF6527 family protein n=1 Tax=Vibrio furnissii TaxID=29494 RepID=UPI00399A78EB
MNMFKKIVYWVRSLFHHETNEPKTSAKTKHYLPPIHFQTINIVERSPKNVEIYDGYFYFVASAEKPKWALFKCPCGCGNVVTLSLQSIHNPFWKLSLDSGRPTLYPSVWRDKGCLSHFWIKDGRVYWCENTGSPPI